MSPGTAEIDDRIRTLAGGSPARAAQLSRLLASPAPGWQLLRGHRLVDGRWMSDASLHAQYVYLTDVLVTRCREERIDRLVYLDKSARPVAWLTCLLWPILAARFDETGSVIERPARPAISFLNIDRLHWRDIVDPVGIEENNVEFIEVPVIEGLRRSLLRSRRDELLAGRDLFAAPTLFGSDRILLVDEVRVGGSTLDVAIKILERALPEATALGMQWMRPSLVLGRDGNRRNNQLPVWYRDDTTLGRGIGDRDDSNERAGRPWRAWHGRHFLSRPLPAADPLSTGLRGELTRLARDAVAGAFTIALDPHREADYPQRCQFFNRMTPIELKQWRVDNAIILDP